MFKYIKKSLALLMCAVMCMSVTFAGGAIASADSGILSEKMILDLKAFEILSGMEDGELHLDDKITRAQLCRIVATVMQLNDGYYASVAYNDLDETHWAYQYISMLSGLGILSGNPDGSINPDSPVTYQEAVKILVVMLGYGMEAENLGGWPNGYIESGARHGVTSGVGAGMDAQLTREQAMRMIYNCLDIRRVVPVISSGNEVVLETAEDTFRDILLGDEEEGMMKIEGIVTANRELYLGEPNSDMDDTMVEIDGVVYNAGNTNIADCFGMNVTAYIKANPYGQYDIVREYELTSKKNSSFEVDIADVVSITDTQFTYTENNKQKNFRLGVDILYLYNGRQIAGNDISRIDIAKINNGVVKVINNTDRNEANIIMIDEYESFLVDRVNVNEKRIYLAENQRFNNSRYIDTDDEDANFVVAIRNAGGNRIGIDGVSAGDIVTVVSSKDKSLIRIWTNSEETTGSLSAVYPDDREIIIGGEICGYELALDLKDTLGQSVLAKFNYRGEVAYIEKDTSAGNYAAIVEVRENLEDGNLILRLAIPGKIRDEIEETESDDPADNEIPAIAAQNESVIGLFTANEVTFNNKKYGSYEELYKAMKLSMEIQAMKYLVVSYSLDSDDNIKKIEELEKMPVVPEAYYADGTRKTVINGEKKYNAYEKSFGGNANGAFGIGDNTVGICVPTNNAESLNDYLARIEMNNGQSYEVAAYKYNKNTHCPDVVVFNKEMHGNTQGELSMSKIALVRENYTRANEDGDIISGVRLLTKDGLIDAEFSETTARDDDFGAINTGDLIKYSLDASDKLDGYEKIVSTAAIPNDRYDASNLECEVYIGTIKDAEFNYVSDTLNKWVDSLYITGNGITSKTYEIQTTSTPPIYIFDTSKTVDDRMTLGTSDDFLSAQEKAIVISSYNAVKAVVIIK